MWLEFCYVALVIAALLVVPGYLALRAVGLPRVFALCCSPLAGLALLAVLGQALALAGVSATAPLMVITLVAVPAAAFLALRSRRPEIESAPRIRPWVPLVYLLVGLALGYNLYVSRLGEPDALFQAYDVTQHLDLVRSMSESGRLTSLDANPYLSGADAAIAPVDLSSFYPAAWHALCAVAVMVTGAEVTVTINASMLVLPCLAFPLGVLVLLATLFPKGRGTQLCGALTSLAFVAFPWNLMAFGPVYPNVAGFSLVPVAMALFVLMLGERGSASERLRLLGVLLAGCAGLALCHPNTLFTCVLLLSPYAVARIWTATGERGARAPLRLLACAGFVAFVVLFWNVCYRLPFLQDTVTHVWEPFAWAWQAIVNILSLSYTFGFNTEIAGQFLLAALVIIGFVRAALEPGRRWMAVSYVLACYVLLISVTHSDEYKQLLAGFWYTDPMRLASNCAIAGIPLATMGLRWVYDLAARLVRAYNAPRGGGVRRPLVAGSVAGVFLLLNFMPEFNLPGLHHRYTEEELEENSRIAEARDWPKTFHTTFGDYRALASEVYSYTLPLDEGERFFVGVVRDLVDSGDSLIINDPMDGSFLAYGTDGLRLYYRNFIGLDTQDETEESRVIRLHLSEYATNEEVRAAVEKVDARYVLVMRAGEDDAGFINLRGAYDDSKFAGISSITSETEGFTLVYGIGDMALYEIER